MLVHLTPEIKADLEGAIDALHEAAKGDSYDAEIAAGYDLAALVEPLLAPGPTAIGDGGKEYATATIGPVDVAVYESMAQPGRMVVDIDAPDGTVLAVTVNDGYVFGGPVNQSPSSPLDLTSREGQAIASLFAGCTALGDSWSGGDVLSLLEPWFAELGLSVEDDDDFDLPPMDLDRDGAPIGGVLQLPRTGDEVQLACRFCGSTYIKHGEDVYQQHPDAVVATTAEDGSLRFVLDAYHSDMVTGEPTNGRLFCVYGEHDLEIPDWLTVVHV